MILPRAAFLSFCALTTAALAAPGSTEPPPVPAPQNDLLPDFLRGPWTNEQICEEWTPEGVHIVALAPPKWVAGRTTRLIFYATPNGNTAEQTLGSRLETGTDWHFDIQHIAAQTRRLRELTPTENIVLICVQADGLSWPAWRQKHPNNAFLIRALVQDWVNHAQIWEPTATLRVSLSGHSGGGSFLFGFLNGCETIPETVDRIAFLDANYSYSDDEHHGDKLLQWLHADAKRRLVVVAYDDRNIMLDGKKVVGPTGGTFRATERMRVRWEKDAPLQHEEKKPLQIDTDAVKQTVFAVHTNPENKILHTALVGEMNGFLFAMGTPNQALREPRTYSALVTPAARIPPRPAASALGGAALFAIADLPVAEREATLARALEAGNLPEFLRNWQAVTVSFTDANAKTHTAVFEVLPDYLAVGNDNDFVRVPLTPMTAQRVAWAFGCVLPTRKMVNDIYAAATVKLAPLPLTEAREAVPTFVQHNALIERQRAGKKLGLLVAGIKKDVVITNRLSEKPHRVAIYGWHKLDGLPIQPLTIVHRNTYVDYSHGIRLIKRDMTVDGKKRDVRDVLRDPIICGLLSDEGPINRPVY